MNESCCATCGMVVIEAEKNLYNQSRALMLDGEKVVEKPVLLPHQHATRAEADLNKRREAIKRGHLVDYIDHLNPWDVECPKCGAQPGGRCENLTDRIKFRLTFTANPHAERSKRKLADDGLKVVFDTKLRESYIRRIDDSK